MKQVTGLRYIYKLEADKLVKNNWSIEIKETNKKELVKKNILIGLADSQGFRFIKEIANIEDDEEEFRFRNYIASIVFGSKGQFDEACKKGITINGKLFKRFVGTSGGIKKNTILFVSEDIYDELSKRANNGRDINVKMVSAKLEAYKALIFSTSIPVTMPKGIAVVHGCITKFKEDTIFINDSDEQGNTLEEPTIEIIKDKEIVLNATDGLGICKPELMLQWTKDVTGEDCTLDTMFGGVCIRNAFTKGMIFPFDIDEWIDEYNNGNSIVKDVWGNDVDLKECQLIITDDVFKLAKSYSSLDDYLTKCKENNYELAVCKTSEQMIDSYRTLNYQYLQSFNMSDKDMVNLSKDTISKIKKCICGDYRDTLKYLGVKENMSKEDMKEFTFKEALALNQSLMNDEYVIKKINSMIKKEIEETGIGKIKVKGNYQISSGDVFALMQSIFGHEITGILKKGEFYSSFWDEQNVNEVLIMRSPMTVHNNIIKGRICHNELARKWYKYMKNILILNSWDNTMSAENGED